MAKQLTDIRQAKDMLEGREILNVEIVIEGDKNGEGSYIVLYVAGLRLYADNPSVYSDDSGDAVAAF